MLRVGIRAGADQHASGRDFLSFEMLRRDPLAARELHGEDLAAAYVWLERTLIDALALTMIVARRIGVRADVDGRGDRRKREVIPFGEVHRHLAAKRFVARKHG